VTRPPMQRLKSLPLSTTRLNRIGILEKRVERLNHLIEMQIERDGGRKQDTSISQWRSELVLVLEELFKIAVDVAAHMQYK
jgi:hypothetical protein